MTPDEAAWVRAHAWTQGMRKMCREVPGFFLTCACEDNGPCLNDIRHPDRHTRCHVGIPLYRYETVISPRDGLGVTAFDEPYRYPTADATGWKYSRSAMVWLADRRCAWWCKCDCGHPRTDMAHAQPSPGSRTMTEREAEWVRQRVLTSSLRLLHGLCRCTKPPALCASCAGHASAPRHGDGDGVRITPETWLYNIHGNPWGAGRGGPTISIWLADRTCRHRCPCGCHARAVPTQVRYEVVPLPGMGELVRGRS